MNLIANAFGAITFHSAIGAAVAAALAIIAVALMYRNAK